MSKQPKRQFDSVAHSATGRVDQQKKGGHGTWGSDKEQMDQGIREFESGQGGQGGGPGGNNNKDPQSQAELNAMGGDNGEPTLSFADYQKSQAGANKTQAYKIKEKTFKKQGPRNNKQRTKAMKVTDSLFAGMDNKSNKNNKNRKNKNKKQNTVQTGQKNQGANQTNKPKNRKAKETLVTAVTYDNPQRGGYRGGRADGFRGRGRGRGRGYNNYGGYGGNRGGYRGRGGGGFGSRGRGYFSRNDNNNNNNNNNNGPPPQYRRVNNNNNNDQNQAPKNNQQQPNQPQNA